MNRSILIVIVDFLLISLLAFSKLDELDLQEKPNQPAPALAKTSGSQQDLVDVLKISLDKERESRETLNQELRRTRDTLQTREQRLQQREEEAQRLDRERATLKEQAAATQADVAALRAQLKNTLSEASVSKERLSTLDSDLRAREEEQARLKQQLTEVEKNRRAAESEKQRLAAQLNVAETEKRLAREQLTSVQGEVQTQREEKARLQEHATKLAEGVSALAEKSGELTKEIRENRPLAANTIFNDFVTNRLRADFRAVRSGLLGREVNREKETRTILVSNGADIYAIYHVQDTPLVFSIPGTDWDWFIANLRHGPAAVSLDSIGFLSVDPRVVVAPITEAQARELGTKVYPISKDPFKFQDAVLIGANEDYYGECKFQIDVENPRYVKMHRERFSRLVGKFLPSSGDFVVSKTGELLGLMVNKEYCLVLNEFTPFYSIQTGIGISNQRTGHILSQLYSHVARLPLKLQ